MPPKLYLEGILSETRRGAGSGASPWKQVKFPKDLPGEQHANPWRILRWTCVASAFTTFLLTYFSPKTHLYDCIPSLLLFLLIIVELSFPSGKPFCLTHIPFPPCIPVITFLLLFPQRVSRNAQPTRFRGFIGAAVMFPISTFSFCCWLAYG